MYSADVRRHNCFDGSSTKDCTHQKRHELGPAVLFNPNLILTLKEQFLSNKANKQKFITLLSEKRMGAGYSTLHATGDTDTLIVNTAIKKARATSTVLIGNDTWRA